MLNSQNTMHCMTRLWIASWHNTPQAQPSNQYGCYCPAALLLAGLFAMRRRDRQLPKNARVKALLAAADTSSGASNYSDDALKKGLILAQVRCRGVQRRSFMHKSSDVAPLPTPSVQRKRFMRAVFVYRVQQRIVGKCAVRCRGSLPRFYADPYCALAQHAGEIDPSEFVICKDETGEDVCLGEGNFGKVRRRRVQHVMSKPSVVHLQVANVLRPAFLLSDMLCSSVCTYGVAHGSHAMSKLRCANGRA